jgi:hypothetical protein
MAIRWRYFTPTVCSRCRFSRHALYFFLRSDASARSLGIHRFPSTRLNGILHQGQRHGVGILGGTCAGSDHY